MSLSREFGCEQERRVNLLEMYCMLCEQTLIASYVFLYFKRINILIKHLLKELEKIFFFKLWKIQYTIFTCVNQN